MEVIRLDLADPILWKAAMTTTSLRALSLRERLAIPGLIDNLFVIAGDSNEYVLFTIDAREKKCSFVFWTEDMEESVLISLKLFCMPVVALYLWGTSHQGQTAVVINDSQNACCCINSRVSCRNPRAQYLIFVLTRAETRKDLDTFAAYIYTKRNSIADQGTQVLTGLTSGAEAADRVEEYYAWAAQALSDYSAEN